jgi:hypothetical protein
VQINEKSARKSIFLFKHQKSKPYAAAVYVSAQQKSYQAYYGLAFVVYFYGDFCQQILIAFFLLSTIHER